MVPHLLDIINNLFAPWKLARIRATEQRNKNERRNFQILIILTIFILKFFIFIREEKENGDWMRKI